jgi:hypothetical protein
MAQGWVTPIIGTISNLSRMQCLDAGMNDVMPKPFLLSSLKTVLAKWRCGKTTSRPVYTHD